MRLKPDDLELMLALSERLANKIPEIRVDWYLHSNQIYFGELTLFTQSGFDGTITDEADRILGDKIKVCMDKARQDFY